MKSYLPAAYCLGRLTGKQSATLCTPVIQAKYGCRKRVEVVSKRFIRLVDLACQVAQGRHTAHRQESYGQLVLQALTTKPEGREGEELCASAASMANSLGARAIFVYTRRGYMANFLSRCRPDCPIFAFTGAVLLHFWLLCLSRCIFRIMGALPRLIPTNSGCDVGIAGCRSEGSKGVFAFDKWRANTYLQVRGGELHTNPLSRPLLLLEVIYLTSLGVPVKSSR